MKQSFFIVAATCLWTVVLTGCHKHEELQTQSTYTFINQTGKRITFDIYNTREDYNQDANRTQQYFIEAGANQKIVFDVAKSYWIDWYSAGYTLNNWRSSSLNTSNRPNPPSEISIASADDTYLINADGDTSRSVLLNGNGLSSTWLASIKNSSGHDGTHKFIFRRDFSGEYTYTDASGVPGITPIQYGVNNSSGINDVPQAFALEIVTVQFQSLCVAKCNLGSFAFPHTGRDTMLLRFNDIGLSIYYPMIRQ